MSGKNHVAATCDAAKPGSIASVTFGWQDATAKDPTRKQWNGTGLIYSAERTVTHELTPTAAAFDIEVVGNTAPKMLFIERAVRAQR